MGRPPSGANQNRSACQSAPDLPATLSADSAAKNLPDFSLFEGDRLNRIYAALGVGKYSRFAVLKRCALVILLTWVPVALLAWSQGFVGGGRTATNFFADFAAYQSAADEIRDLTELSTLGTMFMRIQGTRVVPFDLTSLSQLVGSSFGSIATLLPLLHVSGQVSGVFDALGKLLGRFGGH